MLFTLLALDNWRNPITNLSIIIFKKQTNYCLARFIISSLMHLLHKTPPNGLSGLFFVLAMLLILYGSSLGTPFRTVPQLEQWAGLGFFLL